MQQIGFFRFVVMKEKNYCRITLEERYKIEALLGVWKKVSEIAEILNRPVSTISREVRRGKYLGSNKYFADHADTTARFRNKVKRVYPKLMENVPLRVYMYRGLLKGWSPDQIARRLKLEYPNNESMRISYESIYVYIYRYTQGRLRAKLIKLLPYSKPKRIGISKRYIYMGVIRDRVSIDQRPAHIEERDEIGHWESDLVIGKGQTSAIGTLVERVTRYTIIVPLKSRISKHVVKAFVRELKSLPEKALKTITHDNGVEMAEHKLFTKRTKMQVYFAHPYSSWERGTNENTNGLIRRVFKKKTNFNKVSVQQLKELQDRLNNRPRKVLGYKTPNEMLAELCA